MTGPMPDHMPPKRVYPEKIGDSTYQLPELRLDVFADVTLWHKNPRLRPNLPSDGYASEEDLQLALQQSKGYAPLRRNIADLGQMEPIYVWRATPNEKYLVLEGATRVTILRELAMQKDGDKYKTVVAKELPAGFSKKERNLLLARIHVRGQGIRSWGRYIESQFVYECVTPQDGELAMMTAAELAAAMGKSSSWVSRLKDAYEFAMKFEEVVDNESAKAKAVEHFSVLEEISKARSFGAKVKNPPDAEWEKVRSDVFDMVANDVFSEYRDARYMHEYRDDPEKWERLLSLQKNAAHDLALELKATGSGVKALVNGLTARIERAFQRDNEALNEDDLESLKQAARLIESRIVSASSFQLQLREFTRAAEQASFDDIRKVSANDFDGLDAALEDVRSRRNRAQKAALES